MIYGKIISNKIMKIELDKNGRKLYKFSHSIHQGGYLYAHKIKCGTINKTEIREILSKISEELKLIDVTIKIYDDIIFLFCFLPLTITPIILIESIQHQIESKGNWAEEYIWTTVYDLQEKFVRKDLEKLGFYYDKG